MAEFIITGPDGKKYKVSGENAEGALSALKKSFAAKETGMVDQTMSGVNEGIAGAIGLPVDAVTGALNLALPDSMEIKKPFGGSESLLGAFDPLISDVGPQTPGQRIGRRVGQEVGSGVVMAPAIAMAPGMGAARAAPGTYAATSLAGDVGAGIGGGVAQEIAPGNQTADLIASLLGGGLATGVGASMVPYGKGRSIESVRAEAADKWQGISAAPDALTDDATARLGQSVRGALPTSQVGPAAYPQAFNMASVVEGVKNPKIAEVEDLRRIIGDSVASDPKESRVGVGMKKAIADYLDGLTPNDVTGGDGSIVDDLGSARALTARSHRYDEVLNKEMRGETAAATSGTGGNEVNTQRQKIKALYDIERDPTLRGRRKGFTPDEVEQMGKIVSGTKTQNIARLLGRLAPTSGALPMMATGIGGASGATASMLSGNPAYAFPAIAGGVGFAAKAASESMTKREIAKLLAMIANGGPVKPSAAKLSARSAIAAQLLESMANGQP